MKSKIQNFWDKQAKRYDYSERQFTTIFKEIIFQTKLYLTSEDNVLDFGCATGTKTIELADSVRQIHGLDFSTEMINEANKKIIRSNLKNISFITGSILTTNWRRQPLIK